MQDLGAVPLPNAREFRRLGPESGPPFAGVGELSGEQAPRRATVDFRLLRERAATRTRPGIHDANRPTRQCRRRPATRSQSLAKHRRQLDQAVEAQDGSGLERAGIDETSARRGQHLSKAVDEIRREEAKQHKQLIKNTRYLWLKRPENLTTRRQGHELLQQPLAPVRAYDFSLRFDDFYKLDDPDAAEEHLRRSIAEVHSSDLQPLAKFTRMLEDHWLGVMRSHHSRGVQRAARGSQLTPPSRQTTRPGIPLQP